MAIPYEEIIKNKEYGLASGADHILGHWGTDLVIAGALLATSSAISGTVFGASRQMAVIAKDGFFPGILAKRVNEIPVFSIICMSVLAVTLVIAGDLQIILEFGSVTFLLVSLLMACANFKIRKLTHSSLTITVLSIIGLLSGTILIIYFEFTSQIEQLYFIAGIYLMLTVGAWVYSSSNKNKKVDV